MDFITIYYSVLYYICLLLIARYILDCKPRVWVLCGSFLVFLPLALLTTLEDQALYSIAYITIQILQFLLIKLSFQRVKMRYLVISYVTLYCLNMILVSIAVAVAPAYYLFFDYMINAVTSLSCALLCFSKIRHTVRQVIEWTPKYIRIICGLLLVSATLISVFTSGTGLYQSHETLSRATQITVSILLLAICIVLPVMILISVSNSQLRSLTINYEQQIHSQAEHYQNLAAANYEVRRFRHDFRNMSIAIKKLLADGQQEQALALLQTYNNTLNTPGTFHPAFDTGNGIADALLTDKQQRAGLCNAAIRFQGALPQDSLLPTDLCVILGNTLDNAIEACEKLPADIEKVISITCNCNSGFLFLSICNPVAEKVVVNNNHITTTKENKTLHGFGLYSLNSVVKKYDGEVKFTSTDDSFTVDIDFCLKLDKSLVSAPPS